MYNHSYTGKTNYKPLQIINYFVSSQHTLHKDNLNFAKFKTVKLSYNTRKAGEIQVRVLRKP
jgi:hypothetical protein